MQKQSGQSTQEMQARPIIFSGDMVRAVLSGAKTQTRRVMKPQPFRTSTYAPGFGQRWVYRGHISEDYKGIPAMFGPFLPLCPYGVPGDRLWVRENIEAYEETDIGYHVIRYAVDGRVVGEYTEEQEGWAWGYRGSKPVCGHNYTQNTKHIPSIHMPKWATRIWLAVVSVRVQRVQDMTTADVWAEGISVGGEDVKHIGSQQHVTCRMSKFAELWDSINAKRGYPWSANPWTWCVEFKLPEKADG